MIWAERLCIVPKAFRQGEKESGSVEIKLKRHLVVKVHFIKGIGENCRVIAIVV